MRGTGITTTTARLWHITRRSSQANVPAACGTKTVHRCAYCRPAPHARTSNRGRCTLLGKRHGLEVPHSGSHGRSCRRLSRRTPPMTSAAKRSEEEGRRISSRSAKEQRPAEDHRSGRAAVPCRPGNQPRNRQAHLLTCGGLCVVHRGRGQPPDAQVSAPTTCSTSGPTTARLYSAADTPADQPQEDIGTWSQLVSFGCGVDAITGDEVRRPSLRPAESIYTQIKIDEITNLGAVKIRLRSLFAGIGASRSEAQLD